MVTLHLQNLLFHAFHGIHEEERILGNDYVVDCSIDFHESTEVIEHIDDTINYAILYDIIKERMGKPTFLLETVVMEMGNKIYTMFPEIKSISISIKKMHPPIEGMQGSAGVSWQKQF